MSAADTGTAPGARRFDPVAFGVGALAGVLVAIARLWTSRERRIYGIWPDEPGQLAIARYVGSGVRWNMYNHSTWRPGYGTLLAPVYWFTDDPTTVFRTGLTLNAVLGGGSCVLLYTLTRRLTAVAPLVAGAIAVLVAVSPAVIFTTDFVWSEALVQPLYLAAVVVLLRFNDRPTVAGGAAAGTLAVAAFLAHSRMLPLALVVVAIVGLAAWRRRFDWWKAAAIAGWTAAAFAAASWYSAWIVDRLWEHPFERNSYGGVLQQLGKIDDTFVSLVGQSWYQLVTTGGVVGVGAVAMVRAARRYRPAAATPSPAPASADARIVLACVGTLVALSIIFMSDRWRSDQIVYGRYNDAVVGPVTALGIAALVTTPRLVTVLRTIAAVAATTAGLGLILFLLRRDELEASVGVRAMILGLQSFIGRPSTIRVGAITVAALLIMLFFAVWASLARLARLRACVLLAVATIVLVGYIRTEDIVNRNRNGWATVRTVEALQETVLPSDAPVDYLLRAGSNDTGRMMAYQFYLPHNTFEVINTLDLDDPNTPFVFAPPDNADLVNDGAVIVWEDPGKPIALWVLPGAEQERVRRDGLVLPTSPGPR